MLTRRTDLNDSVFLWWKMHNTFMSVLYPKIRKQSQWQSQLQ